jgi:hypothetical protein
MMDFLSSHPDEGNPMGPLIPLGMSLGAVSTLKPWKYFTPRTA